MTLFWSGVRSALGFIAGFAAAAGTLSLLVAPPRVDIISAKLDWLASRPAEHDVLIVGSSRMRQVIPEILDDDLAAAGHSINSFNLGADGMRPPEDGYVLEQALATRTAPLRLLIMEANRVALRIDDGDEGSDRLTYWHDTPRMATIWSRAWSHSITNPPNAGKWISDTWRNVRHASVHAQYWVNNTVRAGHGSEWLLYEWFDLPEAPELWRGIGAAGDGYVPPDDITPMDAGELYNYNRALTKLRKFRKPDYMERASQNELKRYAKLARKHHARLVLVSPPGMNVEIFQPEIPPGSDTIYLDFSDPAKYPELFEPAVHINGGHLTYEGSRLFTHLIARELAAALKR